MCKSKALVQTQGRLKENGVDGRVALIHDGHENLLSYIDEPLDAQYLISVGCQVAIKL